MGADVAEIKEKMVHFRPIIALFLVSGFTWTYQIFKSDHSALFPGFTFKGIYSVVCMALGAGTFGYLYDKPGKPPHIYLTST